MCKVLALYHVVTTSRYRYFWSNQRTGLDSGNQKELIASVSKLRALNLSLDNIFWVTFLKVYFWAFLIEIHRWNFQKKNCHVMLSGTVDSLYKALLVLLSYVLHLYL